MKLELDVETLEFKISPTKKRPMKVDYLSDSREVLLVRRQTRPRRGELLKLQWANVDSSSTHHFHCATDRGSVGAIVVLSEYRQKHRPQVATSCSQMKSDRFFNLPQVI